MLRPTNINNYFDPQQDSRNFNSVWWYAGFSVLSVGAAITIQMKPDFNLQSVSRVVFSGITFGCGIGIISAASKIDDKVYYREKHSEGQKIIFDNAMTRHVTVQTVTDDNFYSQFLPPEEQPQPQQQYQQSQPEYEEQEYYQPQQQAYQSGNQSDGEYDLDYSYEQPPENTKYFDWKLFDTQPDKYPHLAIVGGTGDGKSFTAENVCRELSGLLIVCHPHKKPTDYLGVKSIHSAGRNYGNWKEDKEVNFKLLIEPNGQNISFASVIKTLYAEMDRRFKLYAQGNENYPMVNAVLDEFNTSVAEVPEAMEVTKKMIREARKVRIRLILLLQDDSVKSLKIQGEGSIRKCFRYVRLGEFAQTYAKRLKNSALLQWVNQQQYPILVGDVAAVIHPKQKQREHQPTEEPDQAAVIDVEAQEVVGVAESQNLAVSESSKILRYDSIPNNITTLDDAIALVSHKLQNPDTPPLAEGKNREQIQLIFKALLYHKQGKVNSIKHLWGITKSGTSKKYQQACELYDVLLAECSGNEVTEFLSQLTIITFPELRLLPASAGVYFVFDSDYQLYYIGSSNNILFRWNSTKYPHHRYQQVEAIAQNKTVKIGWILTSNYERIEADLVARFKPAWNGIKNST